MGKSGDFLCPNLYPRLTRYRLELKIITISQDNEKEIDNRNLLLYDKSNFTERLYRYMVFKGN